MCVCVSVCFHICLSSGWIFQGEKYRVSKGKGSGLLLLLPWDSWTKSYMEPQSMLRKIVSLDCMLCGNINRFIRQPTTISLPVILHTNIADSLKPILSFSRQWVIFLNESWCQMKEWSTLLTIQKRHPLLWKRTTISDGLVYPGDSEQMSRKTVQYLEYVSHTFLFPYKFKY